MTWIKLSEAKPHDGQVVLCATRNMFGGKRYVFPCVVVVVIEPHNRFLDPHYEPKKSTYFYRYGYDQNGQQHTALHVTHWMPLPELPEE